MRFMLLIKATQDFEKGVLPDEKMLAAMATYTEELVKAGALAGCERLQPSSTGTRVHSARGKFTVTDGPFAETKELIAGFSIWEVKDVAEALAWAKRAPVPPGMRGSLEIVPFYEAADLGAYVSPEELATPRTGERGKLGVA